MALSRRSALLGLAAAGVAGAAGAAWWAGRPRPPNVVLILTDDQGYNDLSCTWQPDPSGAFPRLETPRIDSLARDGVRLDTYYAPASVCTPSRGALLTGCYPPRVGFGDKERGIGVFGPHSIAGLAPTEQTLPELLRSHGYRTGLIGKWHLGHLPQHLPTRHGFDDFFGIPYSNNQQPLPLMRGEEVVRRLPDRPVLEGMFTQAAVGWIGEHAPGPFFLYLAHSAPHWPWNVAPEHRAWGPRGAYGDVIARLDWSVGEVLDALDRHGLAEDTIVLFTSDNGPYVEERTGLGGSAWPFRGAKSESWEGGVRSPFLARWPGRFPAGLRSDAMCCGIDVLPTVAGLVGAAPPALPIDGRDLGPLLRGEVTTSPHDLLAYYARGRLEAVRDARFKRMFDNPVRTPAVAAALYDLVADPGETTDVASQHPDVVAALDARAEGLRAELGDALRGVVGAAVRPLGT